MQMSERTQMTRMLDILEDYCWFRNYQYCRIDGGISGNALEVARVLVIACVLQEAEEDIISTRAYISTLQCTLVLYVVHVACMASSVMCCEIPRSVCSR